MRKGHLAHGRSRHYACRVIGFDPATKSQLMLYHLLFAPMNLLLMMYMLLGVFKERRKEEEQEETKGHLAHGRSRHNACRLIGFDPATKSQFMLYHLLLMPTNPLLLMYMLLGEYQERRR